MTSPTSVRGLPWRSRKSLLPCSTAADATVAWAQFQRTPHHLVITDLKMPGPRSGLDLVRDIRHGWPETLILVITAHGSVETAVEAMRLGAHDYIVKPVDLEMLMHQVKKAFAHHRLLEENRLLRQRLTAAGEFPEMIGQSAAIREVFECIRQIADTDLTVLIQGESGTGKELVARAIHNLGRRRSGPFIASNVGALPETLIESELFGYEKGAFSGATRRKSGWFEMAQRGTLFLDEIGEMAPKTQVDLLRVLEQQEVRAWEVASSSPSTCGFWPPHIATCKSCSPRASCVTTSTTASMSCLCGCLPYGNAPTMFRTSLNIACSDRVRDTNANPSESPNRRCVFCANTRGRGTCASSRIASNG